MTYTPSQTSSWWSCARPTLADEAVFQTGVCNQSRHRNTSRSGTRPFLNELSSLATTTASAGRSFLRGWGRRGGLRKIQLGAIFIVILTGAIEDTAVDVKNTAIG